MGKRGKDQVGDPRVNGTRNANRYAEFQGANPDVSSILADREVIREMLEHGSLSQEEQEDLLELFLKSALRLSSTGLYTKAAHTIGPPR